MDFYFLSFLNEPKIVKLILVLKVKCCQDNFWYIFLLKYGDFQLCLSLKSYPLFVRQYQDNYSWFSLKRAQFCRDSGRAGVAKNFKSHSGCLCLSMYPHCTKRTMEGAWLLTQAVKSNLNAMLLHFSKHKLNECFDELK